MSSPSDESTSSGVAPDGAATPETAPPEGEPSPGDSTSIAPPESAAAPHGGHGHGPMSRGDLAKISLGALGVVYGDIGTSPLYAIEECFKSEYGLPINEANVLGILSLVFWSLTLVIVVKYLGFVMRADNMGEGGVLSMLALLKPRGKAKAVFGFPLLLAAGLFGSALLYGDGMITPAISVLSAVEGLGVATKAFNPVVLPITCAILFGLFMAQRYGTARVASIFGPAMLIWFVTIAGIAIPWIVKAPSVLRAVNPVYAAHLLLDHGKHGFLVLGAVVLCITGGEALYADMGHFGKRPIRIAWYAVVGPCLVLNYFGQGALLLSSKVPPDRVFFALVSGWMLYPLVIIATVATVIASQALISGAFSMTQQAVQLGYWPRVSIVHTSGETEGQIYIPEVNYGLMAACIALVLAFKKSSNLAAAYGIAVTGTMIITTVLFYAVATNRWKWSPFKAGALAVLFLAIDFAFFGANIVKVVDGGWFPLAVGVVVFTMMTTWKRGREALGAFIRGATLPLDVFLADVELAKPARVKGTAVFMTSNPDGAPPVLLHHFKHNKVLHEQIMLLSIATAHEPEVPAHERIKRVTKLEHGFYQIVAEYGFMQTPNVLDVLESCRLNGVVTDRDDLSFFLGRETLLITKENKGMARWRKHLFVFLSRNARPANAFFRIPPNRVIELGTQIEL